MTLYFVRHGETDWNREGRLQGGRDIPLNVLGRAQAQEIGRRLATLIDNPARLRFVASPLERARRTMEIARAELGLDPYHYEHDARLAELRFGHWEGLTWREIRTRHPQAARARAQDKWSFVPPDGESYAQLAERLRPALSEIGHDAVIVAHGGVARAALALLADVPQDEAPRVAIWQGRVLMIEAGRYSWA